MSAIMVKSKSVDLLMKRITAALEPHGAVSEFCRKTGISRTAVDKWLDSKFLPSIENLDRIADALGITPAELISDSLPPRHSAEDCLQTIAEWVRKGTGIQPKETQQSVYPADLVPLFNHATKQDWNDIRQLLEAKARGAEKANMSRSHKKEKKSTS